MKTIIEIFRFDFLEKEKSEKRLNELFVKYGFPNLRVTLQNAYDGLWGVINQRDGRILYEMFHSGFVAFFEENNLVKVAFTNEIHFDEKNSIIFCDKRLDELCG
jgi:hypothetical protein